MAVSLFGHMQPMSVQWALVEPDRRPTPRSCYAPRVPTFERDEATIYYEEYGEGFPVLLFAPGGMRSAIPFWDNSPWNPIVELASDFRLIGMDQRNASVRSPARVSAEDGWHTYAVDHVCLLDHLEIERCHLLGGCIGGPYCFGVIQEAHPLSLLDEASGLVEAHRPRHGDQDRLRQMPREKPPSD
jgi:hypothetical protein